jgi:GNAT superfamily N-acetyltransferase
MPTLPTELVRLSSDGPPAFECGATDQNEFLAKHALAGQYDGVSATHLAFRGDKCVGYVTLAMSTVLLERHERPAGAFIGNCPALLVAQLAVSTSARGQGVGHWLLKFSAGVAQG